jgi:hypothetical protein
MPDERYSLEAVDYHKGVTARPVRADDEIGLRRISIMTVGTTKFNSPHSHSMRFIISL